MAFFIHIDLLYSTNNIFDLKLLKYYRYIFGTTTSILNVSAIYIYDAIHRKRDFNHILNHDDRK